MMNEIEGEWRGQLGLPFQIAVWTSPRAEARVVVVRVEGPYWLEAGKREGGPLISMIVAAGLENPLGRGVGLICDFSGLGYTGGDRLFAWRSIQAVVATRNYRIGVVSSTTNRAAVQSLMEYDDDDELLANHFHSLDEALGAFSRHGKAAD